MYIISLLPIPRLFRPSRHAGRANGFRYQYATRQIYETKAAIVRVKHTHLPVKRRQYSL